MTPEELQLLTRTASIHHINTIRTIGLLICYGVYFPLFVKSFAVTQSRIKTLPAARWTFALIIILFISSTIHFGTGIFQQLTMLDWPYQGTPQDDIPTKIQLSRLAMNTANSVYITSGRVTLALIDVIVVWRAYALWPHNFIVHVVLVVCLALSIPYSLALTIWEARDAKLGVHTDLTNKLDILSVFLNFGINALATTCIGVRAWKYRRMQSELFHDATEHMGNSRVGRVLYLIVEGGILLAAFQFVWAILASLSVAGRVSDPVFIATIVFSELIISLSAIYPSLLTILLAEQRSVVDNSTFAPRDDLNHPDKKAGRVERPRKTILSTLRFVSRPSHERRSSKPSTAATDSTFLATQH